MEFAALSVGDHGLASVADSLRMSSPKLHSQYMYVTYRLQQLQHSIWQNLLQIKSNNYNYIK